MPYVERRVPVIADERVELDFGTGALKVTPGHDPKDFEIGRDHVAAGADGGRAGRAHERGGGRPRRPDAGRGRPSGCWRGARSASCSRREEPYRHSIAVCERCKNRIEPLISLQWWCAMDELKQPALEALRERRRPLPPGVAAPVRDRVARERARLEHLAPALVGPPDPALVLPGRRM